MLPCSCNCWDLIHELNLKVAALSLQVEQQGIAIKEFEEIKYELLCEARGDDKNVELEYSDPSGVEQSVEKYASDLKIVNTVSLSESIIVNLDTEGKSANPAGYFENGTSYRNGENSETSDTRKRKRSGDSQNIDLNTLMCTYCRDGHVFKNKLNLRRHLMRAHPMLSIRCSICKTNYLSEDELRRHVETYHAGFLHLCGKVGCSSVFVGESALREHQVLHGHVGKGILMHVSHVESDENVAN